MFEKLFYMIFGGNAAATANEKTQEQEAAQPEPKFLLQETAARYDWVCKSARGVVPTEQIYIEVVEDAVERLRKQEREKIAHEGEILMQTWDCSEAAKPGSSLGYTMPHKKERRLVRFDGRVFLVQLEWRARTREVAHSQGGRYGGSWREFVPTGEFQPPVVCWATDSVAQMTQAELSAMA